MAGEHLSVVQGPWVPLVYSPGNRCLRIQGQKLSGSLCNKRCWGIPRLCPKGLAVCSGNTRSGAPNRRIPGRRGAWASPWPASGYFIAVGLTGSSGLLSGPTNASIENPFLAGGKNMLQPPGANESQKQGVSLWQSSSLVCGCTDCS